MTPDLNDLIGGIYDAAIDPGLWPAALEAVRRHFHFENAMLSIFKRPGDHILIQASCNIEARFLAALPQYSVEVTRLWGGAEGVDRFPLEEPIVYSEAPFWEQGRIGRHYNEWARPQGLDDQAVIILANDATMTANVSLGIHETRPRLTPADLDDLRLIAPHLRRAAIISRLLDVSAEAAVTFRAALDAMACAAILVDGALRIVHANTAAGSLLRQADAVRDTDGQLQLVHELVPGQLAEAVGMAATGADLGRRGLGIPALREGQAPLAVHVMPLARRGLRDGASPTAVAAVFIPAGSTATRQASDAAAHLFGLTPAEARVFELVAAGRSSQQMAQQLGIAESTVRTHLLRVFEKTDRHRRIDLVRLAHELGQA